MLHEAAAALVTGPVVVVVGRWLIKGARHFPSDLRGWNA